MNARYLLMLVVLAGCSSHAASLPSEPAAAPKPVSAATKPVKDDAYLREHPVNREDADKAFGDTSRVK